MKQYYVYIMTNQSGTLYTGVTNDLTRRIYEHRQGEGGHFTSRYRITRLLHFEETRDIHAALDREKQLKGLDAGKETRVNCHRQPQMGGPFGGLEHFIGCHAELEAKHLTKPWLS
jgi:putative endonuclease